jgi:glucose/arabinose dehydrogenase
MIRVHLYAACIMIVLLLAPQRSKGQWISYETKVVAQELNVPWEIRWGYDDWIWFTERSGRFTKINPETGEKKVLLKVPFADHSNAEKGTLGFDFHPNFPDSPFVYIAFNYKVDDFEAFNIVKWRYESDSLIEPKTILDGLMTGEIHNGSRVVVGPDRKLYISTGEANIPELAQDTASRNGKVLRLELDGSIPKDNPYPGNPIWSYGHRNPQGLSFGPTGLLYSTEHGHSTDDELNLIEPGRNYGWPLVEGYCDREEERNPCYNLHVVPPLMAWTPTLAVTGIQYCDRPTFPEWNNSILLATLKDESLWVLKLATDGKSVIASYRYPLLYTDDSSKVHRLRDYCFAPDGRLFVSTSNIWSADWNPDKILEIKRVAVMPFEVSAISPVGGTSNKPEGLQLVWQRTAGDSKYEVQVASTPEIELSIIVDKTLSDTVLPITLLPSEQEYYWRIRELTSAGPWSAIDSFKVEKNLKVSVNDTKELSAYPNPAHKQARLRIKVTDQILRGTVVNQNGRLIRVLSADERSSQEIELNGLPSGSYFISLVLGHDRTQLIPFQIVN